MRINRRLGIGIAVTIAVAMAVLSLAMVTPIIRKAGAQVVTPTQLNAEPNSNTALSFDLTVPTTPCVAQTAVTVTGAGVAVTPLSLTVVDPNTVAVVLPDATPTPVAFTLTCIDGQQQPLTAQASREFFAIPVTKSLVGDVPADATFTVNVACVASLSPIGVTGQSFQPAVLSVMNPLSVDLVFSAAGGTSYVFGYQASDCTITEPGDGGAVISVITPPTVNTDLPGTYPVEVLNSFVAIPTFTG